MRRYRRNADARTRDLERRFAGGDMEAGRELVRVLYQTGQLTIQRALALGDVVPLVLGEIDSRMAEQLGFLFANSEAVQIGPGIRGAAARAAVGSNSQKWFPDWEEVASCPRGHVAGAPHVDWENFELVWSGRNVEGLLLNGNLAIQGMSEHNDGVGGAFLECDTRVNEHNVPIPKEWRGGPPGPSVFCGATWRPNTDLIEYV